MERFAVFRGADTGTAIWVKDSSGLQGVKIDSADFPRVQAFPGTWALPAGGGAKRYVQGKWRNPETGRYETVYLHRWITQADEDTLVQLGGDPLDCRRQNLEVSRKRRSYTRQIARRKSETERLAYTRALARPACGSARAGSPACRKSSAPSNRSNASSFPGGKSRPCSR